MLSTSGRLRILLSIMGIDLLAPGARAEPPARDPQAAEALFEAGREAMDAGDYATACPRFKESYRLDPATGALFALALCHERQGLLASAWVEYMEVAARANVERNAEREQTARDRARALESRLSYLTVKVLPELRSVEGLTVSRNGIELGPAAWGTPIPIDPGRHVLRVSAPGKKPWAASVTIATEPERRVVEVPELEAAPEAPKREEPAARPPPSRDRAEFVFTPLRVAGIGAGSAALASFGIAGFTVVRALDMKADWRRHCDENPCPTVESERLRSGAAATADITTVAMITGGVLAGTGVLLFLLGGPDDSAAAVSAALSPRSVLVKARF